MRDLWLKTNCPQFPIRAMNYCAGPVGSIGAKSIAFLLVGSPTAQPAGVGSCVFEVEAKWIAEVPGTLPLEQASPGLDLGSSDLVYRTKTQPWIAERVFEPLTRRGVKIIYSDLKQSAGVDLVADLMSDTDFDRIRVIQPKTVLCCNILEHVVDRSAFAGRLTALVPAGGHLILTAPRSYPYHEDPIDTGFRPTPQVLAALFPAFQIAEVHEFEAGSYRDQVATAPIRILSRHIIRLLFPFVNYKGWRQSAERFSYLFRSYRVSCLLLRKQGTLEPPTR
jgi:hypothetical protein